MGSLGLLLQNTLALNLIVSSKDASRKFFEWPPFAPNPCPNKIHCGTERDSGTTDGKDFPI